MNDSWVAYPFEAVNRVRGQYFDPMHLSLAIFDTKGGVRLLGVLDPGALTFCFRTGKSYILINIIFKHFTWYQILQHVSDLRGGLECAEKFNNPKAVEMHPYNALLGLIVKHVFGKCEVLMSQKSPKVPEH